MRIGRGSGALHVGVVAEMVLGSEFAHAINTFKTAGGFARLGHRVSVMCLPPQGDDPSAALACYGEPGLVVHSIPPEKASDPEEASRLFSRNAARRAMEIGCEVVYGRNFYIAFEAPRLGLPTVIETHAHVGDARQLLDEVFARTRDARHRLDGIVTIAPILRAHYIARGADPARVHLVPDAADPDLFAPPPEFRRTTPQRARPRVVYSGHLYDYKGIPTMLAAARLSPELHWDLIGGTDEDLVRVKIQASSIENIRVVGRVAHARVPQLLWDADVLVLPPSADHPSAHWTSPVKLGEYLWADRPIAASRIPGLENWISEPAVAWFSPDDAGSLTQCVRSLLAEGVSVRERRGIARAMAAQQYTYANRAAAILGALDVHTQRPSGADPRVA